MSVAKTGKQYSFDVPPLTHVQAATPANLDRVRLDVQVTSAIPVLARFETKVLSDGGDFLVLAGDTMQFFAPCPLQALSFYNPHATITASVAVYEATERERSGSSK